MVPRIPLQVVPVNIALPRVPPTTPRRRKSNKENDPTVPFSSRRNGAIPIRKIRRKPVPAYTSQNSLRRGLASPSRLGGLAPRPQCPSPAPAPKPVISIEDFDMRRLLGSGAQGQVYLATRRSASYAIKVVSKARLMAGTVQMIQEQDLLRKLQGGMFVLGIEASFHDSANFYLLSVSSLPGFSYFQ